MLCPGCSNEALLPFCETCGEQLILSEPLYDRYSEPPWELGNARVDVAIEMPVSPALIDQAADAAKRWQEELGGQPPDAADNDRLGRTLAKVLGPAAERMDHLYPPPGRAPTWDVQDLAGGAGWVRCWLRRPGIRSVHPGRRRCGRGTRGRPGRGFGTRVVRSRRPATAGRAALLLPRWG